MLLPPKLSRKRAKVAEWARPSTCGALLFSVAHAAPQGVPTEVPDAPLFVSVVHDFKQLVANLLLQQPQHRKQLRRPVDIHHNAVDAARPKEAMSGEHHARLLAAVEIESH